jgi:Restriction alleviation protein Lar
MAEDAWRGRATRDEGEPAMTMPHLMNCAHCAEGWCLECVGHLHAEVQNAQQACALSGTQAHQRGQALDVPRTPEGEPLGSHLARLARKHDLSGDFKAAIRQAAELLSVPGAVLPGAQHGLPEGQEPKYTVNGRAIVNRASNEEIPHDEPVFILRARDVHAMYALRSYLLRLPAGSEHRRAVEARCMDFFNFKAAHLDRMKEPDSQRSCTEPGAADVSFESLLALYRPVAAVTPENGDWLSKAVCRVADAVADALSSTVAAHAPNATVVADEAAAHGALAETLQRFEVEVRDELSAIALTSSRVVTMPGGFKLTRQRDGRIKVQSPFGWCTLKDEAVDVDARILWSLANEVISATQAGSASALSLAPEAGRVAMNDAELKPCPWCHAPSPIALTSEMDGYHVGYVHCPGCGACGPEALPRSKPEDARADARQKWQGLDAIGAIASNERETARRTISSRLAALINLSRRVAAGTSPATVEGVAEALEWCYCQKMRLADAVHHCIEALLEASEEPRLRLSGIRMEDLALAPIKGFHSVEPLGPAHGQISYSVELFYKSMIQHVLGVLVCARTDWCSIELEAESRAAAAYRADREQAAAVSA